MKRIVSAANTSYREWLRLARHPRAVREQRRTLAEGLHLAAAVLDSGFEVLAVVLRAGRPASMERDELVARATARGTPAVELAAPLYDALGVVKRGSGLMLAFALPSEGDGPLQGDAVYLDGVQEPGNLGALLRVAAAAGVRHALAGPGTASLWAPKVLRGAQGAHFRLDLREAVAPEALLDGGRYAGHWIGTLPAAAEPLWSARLPAGRIGWVIGSEGQGISAAARAACRQTVTIPLAASVESLNVTAAAAVCLFERRRRLAGDASARR